MGSIAVLSSVAPLTMEVLGSTDRSSPTWIRDLAVFGGKTTTQCRVFVDGTELHQQIAPIVEDSQIYIDVLDVFLRYGYAYEVDDRTQVISFKSNSYTVIIDKKLGMATINGVHVKLVVKSNNRGFFVESSCLDRILPVTTLFDNVKLILSIQIRLGVIVNVVGMSPFALVGDYDVSADDTISIGLDWIGLVFPGVKVRSSDFQVEFTNPITCEVVAVRVDRKSVV